MSEGELKVNKLALLLEVLEESGKTEGGARLTTTSSIKGGKRYEYLRISLDHQIAETLKLLGWKPGMKLRARITLHNGRVALLIEPA